MEKHILEIHAMLLQMLKNDLADQEGFISAAAEHPTLLVTDEEIVEQTHRLSETRALIEKITG